MPADADPIYFMAILLAEIGVSNEISREPNRGKTMPIKTETFRKDVLAPMRDNFARVKYPPYLVADQARLLRGWLERDLLVFQTEKVPITNQTLERLDLCLAVLAEEGADRAEKKISADAYHALIEEERARFAKRKEQVLYWAKASELDWRLFNVNMGQGSVPHFLGAGDVFVQLLERQEKAFVSPPHIAALREEVLAILGRVRDARVARGLDKGGSKEDTLTVRQATRVLYDELLRVSRIGQALFFLDAPHRDGYRLSLLQPERPSPSANGDDDAPILEPAAAGEAGVTVPDVDDLDG